MARNMQRIADAWKAAEAAAAARRAATAPRPKPFDPFPAPATGGDLIPVPAAKAQPPAVTPAATPADLSRVDSSATPITPVEYEIDGKRFDLDGNPIDDPIPDALPAPRQPDPAAPPPAPRQPDPVVTPDPIVRPRQPDPDVVAPPEESMLRRILKIGGLVGGGALIRELLKPQTDAGGGQRLPPGVVDIGVGGQQPPPPMGPPGPPVGFPLPYPPHGDGSQDLGAKPEDRIRALRNFSFEVNPKTQILQNFTR